MALTSKALQALISGIVASLLIISCSDSGTDSPAENETGCENLLMTDDTGEIIGERGDPSDQWTIRNFEMDLEITPPYPNPATPEADIGWGYEIPETVHLKIQMQHTDGGPVPDIYQTLRDENVNAGIYTATLNGLPAGCYRIDFFFDESKESNANGFILVE